MSRMHSMPVYSGSNRSGPPGFGRANSLKNIGSPQATQPMTPPPRSWSRSPPAPPMNRRAVSLQPGGAIHAQMDRAVANEENKTSWFGPKEKAPTPPKEVADVLAALTLDDTTLAEAEQQSQSGRPSPLNVPSPTTSTPPRVESPPSPVAATSPIPTPPVEAQSNPLTPSPTPPKVPVSAGPTPFAAIGSTHPPLSPGPPPSTSGLNHLATPFSGATTERMFGTPTSFSGGLSMQRALTEIPEASFLPQPVSNAVLIPGLKFFALD